MATREDVIAELQRRGYKGQIPSGQAQTAQPESGVSGIMKKFLPSMGQGAVNAASVIGGGKPIYDQTNGLDEQLKRARIQHLLQPKQQTQEEGYTDESQIPKSIGGIPLEGVTTKNGRFIPSYKNPAQGGVGQTATGQPLNYETTGDEFLNQLSPEDQNIVKGLVNYTIDPIHTFGGMKGAQRREHMMAMAQQVDPEFNSSEYNARYKYNQDLRSGKVAQNVRSLNTATKHLQSLDESMGGLSSGSFPAMNAVSNWWKKQTGNPAPAEVDTALQAVAGELATVFKNSSGTDQEIGHWLKTFDPNASQAQKHAFIDKAIELMEGRLGAMEDQYAGTMGKQAPEGTFISKNSRDIMDNLRAGEHGNSVHTPEQIDLYNQLRSNGISPEIARKQAFGG